MRSAHPFEDVSCMRKSTVTSGLLALTVAVAVAACHRTAAKDKPWAETTSGGGIGVPAGAVLVAGMGTVLVRHLLGGSLGRQLDSMDRQLVVQNGERTLEHAPDGQTVTWKSPHSGNSGTITATSTYQADNGLYCREYRQTIRIAEKEEEDSGIACRHPEGFWGYKPRTGH